MMFWVILLSPWIIYIFKFVMVSSSNVVLGSFAAVIIFTILQDYTIKFSIINESVL